MLPDGFLLASFVAIVLVAVYFHTVTGFGLAMIIMGLAGGMGVASVAALASVISLMTLVNSALALRGHLHHIDWRIAAAMIAGIVPASVLGVLALDYLSSTAADAVQILLGLVIVYGGVSFALRPRVLERVSGLAGFAAYGFFGGFIGGMFGIPGPPLIFQFYRQPMELVRIRSFLILVNAVVAGARTLFVGAQGQLDADIWALSAVCLPVAAAATWAGRRYPPPFTAAVMRRIAFAVLFLMGMGLILPVVPAYL
ncbi:TSUP family transporter [Parapusillimonas granuli]|uniref:Probable membrane transporter protein n=1 Tax=Parapusillimonas granuli TaxID=380911 RepID=A0A853G4A8_9BURK|nr:TSUP family transporter [Parapusillimonas granuli]MBB5216044.1 putative membrane protein YfcA [Parapusillimonas granuli]MEB2401316.1 TSUP family transporter [Alcaligenaceae bacterium]NYT50662.1 TSUP family transporter [Parapusillimonas granuli]